MRRALAMLLLALVPSSGACSADEATIAPAAIDERWRGPLSARAPVGAVVVATVDGVPIHDLDVNRHGSARRLDAKAALAELIDLELLAGEAQRRGLADAPEVIEARRRERVRRVVEHDFEAGYDGPEDVPEAEVARVWADPVMRQYFQHDVYHEVTYVRLPVDKGKDDQHARGVAIAVRAAVVAATAHTRDRYVEVALAEALRHGITAEYGDFSTTRHRRAVEEFAIAAFSIDEVGEVSEPARTPWGWDLVLLRAIIPERRTPEAEARREIRKNLFADSRRAAFLRFTGRLVAGPRPRPRADLDATLAGIDVVAPLAMPGSAPR